MGSGSEQHFLLIGPYDPHGGEYTFLAPPLGVWRLAGQLESRTRRLGITPFLDLILTSPHATVSDFALTVREAFRWIRKGCEVGIYPYVTLDAGSIDEALLERQLA
jgi:hypothetical protein